MHVTCRAYQFLCLQLVFNILILKNSLSIVVVSYKKLSQFVKYFSFTSLFDGKILDKSYSLKYFYKRIAFLLLLNSKVLAQILKITQIKKVLFKPQCCLFYQVFCIITTINLFLKSTVELCVIITVLISVILVFNTIFVIFKVITIYYLVFFALLS